MTYEDFVPHWKKQDQCFEDEKVELKVSNGKKITKPWPQDKPVALICYEEDWLKKVVDLDTNEFYPSRNKHGSLIKGTGGKHITTHPDNLNKKKRR